MNKAVFISLTSLLLAACESRDGPAAVVLAKAVCSAQGPWQTSTRFAVTTPQQFGAVSDGSADAAPAINFAVNALPASGGIVYFPPGTYLKPNRLLTVTKSHVLFWTDSNATIHSTVRAKTAADSCGVRQQGLIFERTDGGGVHGLRFTTTAAERTSCAEDSQLVLDGVNDFEMVGNEIHGANSTGIFAWDSNNTRIAQRLKIVGNYIHHTYADSIHHTSGTRWSYVWENDLYNAPPSSGDDGIACVTYGQASPRCGDMEWWRNRYLGGDWGRGLAVVGGDHINIHHNWIVGSPNAGVLIASESNADTPPATDIVVATNWLVNSPSGLQPTSHSALLVSGGNSSALPVANVAASGNIIINPYMGRVERAEGLNTNITFADYTDPALLPEPAPAPSSAKRRSTAELRTWDTSFVPANLRMGLNRIHLQRSAIGTIWERFEYVVKGPKATTDVWVAAATTSCTGRVMAQQVSAGSTYTVLQSATPLALPSDLLPVSFEEQRAGDLNGSLSNIWQSIN